MSRAVEESNRRMLLRTRRDGSHYAKPLDVPTLARIAYVSEAHFIQVFRATFGETPHRYLQRRRVERARWPTPAIGTTTRWTRWQAAAFGC